MEKINWGRVVLGGVLAGTVLIVLATACAALLLRQQELRAAVQELRPSPNAGAALLFIAFVFLFLGMLMTTAYAVMRPRFGPGPKTAAVAGFAVWLTGVWLGLVGFALKSLIMSEPYPLPAGPALPCIYLAMLITSTLAGAWVYREQQA